MGFFLILGYSPGIKERTPPMTERTSRAARPSLQAASELNVLRARVAELSEVTGRDGYGLQIHDSQGHLVAELGNLTLREVVMITDRWQLEPDCNWGLIVPQADT